MSATHPEDHVGSQPTNFELTVEFHRAIGQAPPAPADIRLRQRLLKEETREAVEALKAFRHGGPIEDVAKELADVLCVAYGAAAALGIPMDRVYREVHASNMSKVGDGRRRHDGKVLKGPGYWPPDIAAALQPPRPANGQTERLR